MAKSTSENLRALQFARRESSPYKAALCGGLVPINALLISDRSMIDKPKIDALPQPQFDLGIQTNPPSAHRTFAENIPSQAHNRSMHNRPAYRQAMSRSIPPKQYPPPPNR
jgi:hypothetical protein